MKHRRLGRSALRIGEIGLGTMNFGPSTSESDAFAILDAAVDVGINLIDTADQYGGHRGVGTAESIIGRWLTKSGRRDQVVVATKVHEPMSDDVNDRGLSAYHIRRACDASLRRLQTDHIDLYQMHHIDRAAPWEEIWQAMEVLIDQGKISYVGSSNFPGWSIASANERADRRNLLGLVSEQSLYNLAERTAELEVLPACEAYGVGMLPWSPLAGGLLAGPPSGSTGRRTDPDAVTRVADRRVQLDRWERLCADMGEAPGVVALAWLLSRHGVTAPIIGPRTLDQLHSACRAADLELDDRVLRELDDIFPGPGPAPEAYAW